MTAAKAKETAATAAAAVLTATAAAVVLPIEVTPEQRAHKGNKRTIRTIGLFNAMLAHGHQALFPYDMPADATRQQLVKSLAANEKVADMGAAQRTSVAQRNEREKAAKKLLRRMKQLVRSAYPLGSTQYVAFFPAAVGLRTTAGRLIAMAEGLAQYGLPQVPPDITPATLIAHAHGVAVDGDQRTDAETAVETATGAKVTVVLRSSQIYSRLVLALRGFYGEESEELAKFAIKPIVRVGPSRGRKLTEEEKAARRAKREQKQAQEKAARKARQAERGEAKADQDAAKADKDAEKARLEQQKARAEQQKARQDAQDAADEQKAAGETAADPAAGTPTI